MGRWWRTWWSSGWLAVHALVPTDPWRQLFPDTEHGPSLHHQARQNQVLHMSFVHYTWWCPALPVVHPWPVQQSYKPAERDSQINASLFPPAHSLRKWWTLFFQWMIALCFLEVTMKTDNPPLFQWGAGQRAHSGGTDWHLRCCDDGHMLAPWWIPC